MRSSATLLALVAWLALAPAATLAQEIQTEPISLRVDAPEDGLSEVGPSSLVEVRGYAGALSMHQGGQLDVVAIVDISFSTRNGSGVDVDGDGHAGGFGWRFRKNVFAYPFYIGRSTDPDDTILRAETHALRILFRNLTPGHSRLGVIGLREYAEVHAPIPAAPNVIEGALRLFERRRPEGRTNFFESIRAANQMLVDVPDDGVGRQKAIILLSDGYPTVPSRNGLDPTEMAIEAAKESAKLGIKIFSFSLGQPKGELDSRALREAARVTRGKYVELERAGDVIRELSEIRFTGLEKIEIVNRTSGKPASMQRLFPNGTFDAFVRLEPGENRIHIRATTETGEILTEERVVHYKLVWPHDRNARWKAKRKIDEIHQKLRDRQATSKLVKEMQEKRQRLARELDIEVEE